jgi:tRNA pseudouridine55 synthase
LPDKRTSGIIICDKPSGKTSHTVVREAARRSGIDKAGHTGTLDKFAEGVLPILVGSYTRLSRFILERDKRYEAWFTFGRETDTLDPEGEVIATGPVPERAELEAVLPSFVGQIEQKPPAYSAIHLDGKRAYELALSGQEVEMPSRHIEIFSIDLIEYADGVAHLSVHCGKGTYIRSLARDIALAMGTRAFVSRLIRAESAGFTQAEAIPLSEIRPESPRAFTLVDAAKAGLSYLNLNDARFADFRNGKPLSAACFLDDNLPGAGEYLVFSAERGLVGAVSLSDGHFHYELVLGDA